MTRKVKLSVLVQPLLYETRDAGVSRNVDANILIFVRFTRRWIAIGPDNYRDSIFAKAAIFASSPKQQLTQ
jgi:hypothetical protein